MPQTNTLDFSTPAGGDKALKYISQQLGRAGQAVVSSEFNQKPKRTSDTTYREAYLTLASGQLLTLRVNATGDIYQVVLNSSVQPLKEHADTDKAIVEIAGLATKNQAAFQKAEARKQVALPKGMTTPRPKIAEALTQQVAALDGQITERQATIADLKAKLGAGAMTDGAKPTVLPELTDGAKDVLRKLLDQGPLEDGDIPSKSGRDDLIDLGYIDRYTDEGANVLNDKGRAAAAMLDSASASIEAEPSIMPLASAYVAARELSAANGVMLDAFSTSDAKAYAKGYLQIGLETVETNGPLSLERGDLDQARLQMNLAESFRAAMAMLDSAGTRQPDDAALAQLVAIAKADAASEDEIADQDALATLLALSMVDTLEGIYFLTEAGRQHLNDNGLDAYGEPFGE